MTQVGPVRFNGRMQHCTMLHVTRQSGTLLMLHVPLLTLRTLMSTTVDILCFISTFITPDNQLLKIKYAFNLETLIYIGT